MLAKPRTLWIGILDVTVPFLGSGCLVLWTNGRKAKWLQDKSINPGIVWFVQPQWSNLPWTSWGCHSPNCHLISVVTVGTRLCVGHFNDVFFAKGCLVKPLHLTERGLEQPLLRQQTASTEGTNAWCAVGEEMGEESQSLHVHCWVLSPGTNPDNTTKKLQ